MYDVHFCTVCLLGEVSATCYRILWRMSVNSVKHYCNSDYNHMRELTGGILSQWGENRFRPDVTDYSSFIRRGPGIGQRKNVANMLYTVQYVTDRVPTYCTVCDRYGANTLYSMWQIWCQHTVQYVTDMVPTYCTVLDVMPTSCTICDEGQHTVQYVTDMVPTDFIVCNSDGAKILYNMWQICCQHTVRSVTDMVPNHWTTCDRCAVCERYGANILHSICQI